MKNTLRNSSFRKSLIKRLKIIMLCLLFLCIIGLVRVQAQIVTDIEGNVYNTVTIGTQVWMAENLKTTKFNDGTEIPNITDNNAWAILTTGAYCDHSNIPANSTIYGRLYNWYVVDNNAATKMTSNGGRNVCPTSWHVPTETERSTLTTYLGGVSVAGGKLKETGTTHWLSPNTGATNETSFTALPGAGRNYQGAYSKLGNSGYWWNSTEYDSDSNAYSWAMDYSGANVRNSYSYKQTGLSVRCVRDILTDITNPSTSTIEVYPNPVSDILNIDYKGETFETVSILNSQGVLLTKKTAIMPRQQLDFSKYAYDLYILEFVKATGEKKIVKVVKQ